MGSIPVPATVLLPKGRNDAGVSSGGRGALHDDVSSGYNGRARRIRGMVAYNASELNPGYPSSEKVVGCMTSCYTPFQLRGAALEKHRGVNMR